MPNRTSQPHAAADEHPLFILEQVIAFLDHHGAPHWLDQGTLLGAVRDGAPIPWDEDLDISTWADVMRPLLPTLKNTFSQAGCLIFYSPDQIKITCRANGPLPVDMQLYHRVGHRAHASLRASPAGRLRRKTYRKAKKIESALVRARAERLQNNTARKEPQAETPFFVDRLTDRVSLARDHLMRKIPIAVDASFFEELHPIMLNGVAAKKPSAAEEYLSLKYGNDWRTPKRQWDYRVQDGAIAVPPSKGR